MSKVNSDNPLPHKAQNIYTLYVLYDSKPKLKPVTSLTALRNLKYINISH